MRTVEYPNSYIVWDLETSGLDPVKDKILEIGMFMVADGEVTATKRWVLNHGIKIPEHITAINGMNEEIMIAEGRDPATCLKEFLSFVNNSKANLTHNGIKFDIGFLVESYNALLVPTIEEVEKLRSHLQDTAIDTAVIFKADLHGFKRQWNETFHQFAKRVMEAILRGKYNLGVCCDELKIDRSTVTQHRALGDVQLTNEVFKALLIKHS